jgi:hypothetical protein
VKWHRQMSRRTPCSEHQLRRLIWRKTMYAITGITGKVGGELAHNPLASAFAVSCGTQARVKSVAIMSSGSRPPSALRISGPAIRCDVLPRSNACISGSFLYRLDQLSNEPSIAHVERSESVLRVGQTIRSPSSTGRSGPILRASMPGRAASDTCRIKWRWASTRNHKVCISTPPM